jgi:release factor glutamine methyltransferase
VPETITVVERLRAAGCVFAEDETRLLEEAASTPEEVDALVGKRVSGLPLEQVVGWAEFYDLRIAVEPGVFVPRPRSEFLVRTAITLSTAADPVIVDLCCGTGALGLAVASAFPAARLHAADVDAVAVRCACRNVLPTGGQVYQGDLFCNAPYVPTDEVSFLPTEARDHEPPVALDGGPDGLAVLRRVAAQAPHWLAPRGFLLVETSERQAPLMADAMARAGLSPQLHSDGELGASVVTGTCRP